MNVAVVPSALAVNVAVTGFVPSVKAAVPGVPARPEPKMVTVSLRRTATGCTLYTVRPAVQCAATLVMMIWHQRFLLVQAALTDEER